MNDFQFNQQLEEKDASLDYASKAAPNWTPAISTCILGTLLKNWPEQSKDDVYYRLERRHRNGVRIPVTTTITTHRGGLQ